MNSNIYIIPNALNGSFVYALREKNPTARIICAEVFPYYVEHLKNNLKVEVYKVDTSKNLMLQLLTMGRKMKIDWSKTTVLMNAPYQEVDEESGDRKDQASNLWGDFIYAFAELAPRMTSVQPSSWLSPSKDFSGKRYDRFADEWREHFKTLNIKECAKHFPKVGSHFTYFTLDKLKKYPLTKLITENGTLDYQFNKNPVLGYNGLTVDGIESIGSTVHNYWSNDFGFSRQGYNSLNEKENPYALTGTYPIYHTNKQKITKPSKKSKKKSGSYLSSVITVAEHAGIKAAFTYSNTPHPNQFNPKVLVCLSGEYNPVLDEHGEIGYTGMSMPIICKYKSEARRVYKELTSPDVVKAMSCLKWNGFVNIEVLMRLICKNKKLRLVRKNSIHAQSQYGVLDKTHTVLKASMFKVKYMELSDKIKKTILDESINHHSEKQAQANIARRAKARTDTTGEVFTPSELVIEMLESLPADSWHVGEHHIDPAMGNGQFLAASAIARAELRIPQWLENTFGVDLMKDNVNESKVRLVQIAIKYGYSPENAVDIVNENLHQGNTLDPDTKIAGQSEKSHQFMKDNFKTEKIKELWSEKANVISSIDDLKSNTFDNFISLT